MKKSDKQRIMNQEKMLYLNRIMQPKEKHLWNYVNLTQKQTIQLQTGIKALIQ